MPAIFRQFGMVFFFYSLEHFPIHVHVKKAGANAKFEINPVKLINAYGFTTGELNLAEALVKENEALILQKWTETFGL